MKALISILFIITLICCQKTDLKDREEKDLDLLMQGIEVLDSVRLIYSDSAYIRAIVSGPKMHRQKVKRYDQDEFIEGVFAEFYDRDMTIQSTLKAGYALRREKDDQIYVRDHVVLVNREQEKLETSELIWKEKLRKITTEKAYKITRKDGTVYTGFGFTANEDFTVFRSHSVQMRLKM